MAHIMLIEAKILNILKYGKGVIWLSARDFMLFEKTLSPAGCWVKTNIKGKHLVLGRLIIKEKAC